MTAAKRIQLVSEEDYLEGELRSRVKHEFSGGYVYMKARATNTHNRVAVSFVTAMSGALRGKKCEAFNSDTKVRLYFSAYTRFYYPDGMVVCDPNPGGDSYQDRPVVIAEIISESTRRTDEGEKREAYLTIPSLSTYLLIESVRPMVTVHQRVEGTFIPVRYEGLDSIIPLDAIGASLSLADLYERIDFAAAQAEEAGLRGDESE